MATITLEDIIESNRLKKEGLEAVKNDLKGILSQAEIDKLEEVYKAVTKKYIFQKNRREH